MLRKLKNFFLPQFSELEFFTLLYLILLLSFAYNSWIVNAITALPEAIAIVVVLLGLWILGLIIYKALYHAFSKHPMSFADKQFLAGFYYVALIFTSMASISASITPNAPESLFRQLEYVFVYFMMVRSTIAGLVLLGTTKSDELKAIYATQLTDEQSSIADFACAIALSSIFYLVLRESSANVTAVALSFFYTNVILFVWRTLRRKLR